MSWPTAVYELTVDDLIAHYEWDGFQRPLALSMCRGFQIIATVLVFSPSILSYIVPLPAFYWSFITIPCVIIYAFAWAYPSPLLRPAILRVQRKHFNATCRSYLMNYKLELTPVGIRHVWPNGESLIPWSAYMRVDFVEDHLFFYRTADCLFSLSGLKLGLPVPRRAFPNDDSFHKFYDIARLCIEHTGR